MADRSTGGGHDGILRVARRLAVLPERKMREAALGEIVLGSGHDEAVWLLDALATAGRAGGPPFDLSLLAAVDLASGERLTYDQRRGLFEAAGRLGLQACRELFLSGDPDRQAESARPRALQPGMRPLTLGERKSLARSWRRDVIERLVVDPSADVVELLLVNPHLTEEDVLRIATGRRTPAAVLALILRSRRWAVRPRVRRALVRNPRLPSASAVRLVGLLNTAELRDMENDRTLDRRVLESVRRRLQPRS